MSQDKFVGKMTQFHEKNTSPLPIKHKGGSIVKGFVVANGTGNILRFQRSDFYKW